MFTRGFAMTTFSTTRKIPAPTDAVFAALTGPQRLARWWGPGGFTNTFQVCDVRAGGQWRFDMHGPDGKVYPNHSQFLQIVSGALVRIGHVSAPQFELAIGLSPSPGGTAVSWTQTFADATVAAGFKAIVEPANEQNLDRLTREVLSVVGGAA
jgi:uncharacterized protein YndB with AHSA1/START domain